jgi:sporulation protein YlmC with PRC-barrel domain
MARKRDSARDRAGTGPDPDRGVRLVSIDRLKDFEIGQGEPDIRGWEVRTLSGRQLGDVKDLLVDPEAGEVVMLEIESAQDDRRTLAPIRAAQIDRDRRCIVIDSGEVDRGGALPGYRRGGHVSPDEARDFEDRYRRAYGDAEHGGGYSLSQDDENEVVIERRPVAYEEVVVRRTRVAGEGDRTPPPEEPDRDGVRDA